MLFQHNPKEITEREREEAAYAYVMSLMTVMVGLPFPIINLIGCVGYFLLIRSKSKFVRFHAFQAMVSQTILIMMNTACIFWTVRIVFYDVPFTNLYLGYLIMIFISNITDYIFNIVAAVKARKGQLYFFLFFGPLSHLVYYRGGKDDKIESQPAVVS